MIDQSLLRDPRIGRHQVLPLGDIPRAIHRLCAG